MNPPAVIPTISSHLGKPEITSISELKYKVVKSVPADAFVKILEQPAPYAFRFRYQCEKSAGSVRGQSCTKDEKSFPAIQVVGHLGRFCVVVSCVSKNPPFWPHPYNIVGKSNCKNGVYVAIVCDPEMVMSFPHIGIQCCKQKDVPDSLELRQKIRVDPFRTGYKYDVKDANFELNSLRLCFQVFLEGPKRDQFFIPLRPIVSDAIYDKRCKGELMICKLSRTTASASGGTEVMLFCEKIEKDDIQIRFYQEVNGQIEWEAFGIFDHKDIHKRVGISFKTPEYTLPISSQVLVKIELVKPSDGFTSKPLQFTIEPVDNNGTCKRKRQMNSDGNLINCENLNQEESQSSNEKTDTNQEKHNEIMDKGISSTNTELIKNEMPTLPRQKSPLQLNNLNFQSNAELLYNYNNPNTSSSLYKTNFMFNHRLNLPNNNGNSSHELKPTFHYGGDPQIQWNTSYRNFNYRNTYNLLSQHDFPPYYEVSPVRYYNSGQPCFVNRSELFNENYFQHYSDASIYSKPNNYFANIFEKKNETNIEESRLSNDETPQKLEKLSENKMDINNLSASLSSNLVLEEDKEIIDLT